MDSPAPGPSTEAAIEMPRFSVKEANFLTLKPRPKGQASNLTHLGACWATVKGQTSRHHVYTLPLRLTPATGHQFPTLPLPYRAPVFLRGKLLHKAGAPVFVAATHRMPLDCLALEASRACVSGFHGTIAIGDSS